MNSKPTLMEGAVIGIAISIGVSLFFVGGISLLSGGLGFRFLTGIIFLIYTLYLLSKSQEKTGKITIISIWLLVSVLNFLFTESVLLYVTIYIAMTWLIRSLYFYNSLLSSGIDLLVTVLASFICLLTWNYTGSLLLTIWSFFLIQSLFVFIPRHYRDSPFTNANSRSVNTAFEQACRNAEVSLEKLQYQRSSTRNSTYEQ